MLGNLDTCNSSSAGVRFFFFAVLFRSREILLVISGLKDVDEKEYHDDRLLGLWDLSMR